MIRNDLVSRLQLLLKSLAPPLIEVAQAPPGEARWMPGQALVATVLGSLPNGRFLVQVGDLPLDMNLPHNTQTGAQLELTCVSNQPRLTFLLTRASPVAADHHSPAAPGPQVTISDSVRYLGALLQGIAEQAQAQIERPHKAAAPLCAAPADIKEFATSLRSALSRSGLFYESHQAQWVSGHRMLADLLLEPQGRLSVLTPAARAEAAQNGAPVFIPADPLPAPGGARAPVHAAAVSLYESHQTQWGAAEAKPDHALPEPHTGIGAPKSGTAAEIAQPSAPAALHLEAPAEAGAAKTPVHPETAALVQQQLHTLDSRQMIWQGQVWPGQPMNWRVEERSTREGAAGSVETREWQTRLHLQLPRLGDVLATLAVTPKGLRLELKAKEAGTAQAMRGAQGTLRDALADSGLTVLAMSVERHEEV